MFSHKGGLRRRRRAILFWILALAVVPLGAGLLYREGYFRFAYPSRAEFPVRGIDVSHHQGRIDWMLVAQGETRFVYIKASEGGDWRDPLYTANMAGAQATNMRVGAYHFFTLCSPGEVQARNFLAIAATARDLSPAIDLEYVGNCAARPSRQEFEKELTDFIRVVRGELGVEPILYTMEDFYSDYLEGGKFSAAPLWVRDIFFGMSWPDAGHVVFRQFANKGRVAGISGPVDLNHFIGSQEAFEKAFPRPQ